MRSIFERKVIDTTVATYPINTTGSVTLLNGISTGDDFTNRDGRQVTAVSVQARGFITADLSGGGDVAAQMVRFLLVVDQQINGGALPTATTLLEEASGTSFNNLNNRDRFKVLHDSVLTLGPISRTATQSFSGGSSVHTIDVYKPCQIPVLYEGTAATIGSISSGAIYALFMGTTAAGTADAFAVMSFRVRFMG